MHYLGPLAGEVISLPNSVHENDDHSHLQKTLEVRRMGKGVFVGERQCILELDTTAALYSRQN